MGIKIFKETAKSFYSHSFWVSGYASDFLCDKFTGCELGVEITTSGEIIFDRCTKYEKRFSATQILDALDYLHTHH